MTNTPSQMQNTEADAKAALSRWIDVYRLSGGATRREASAHIKTLARTYPLLADHIPEEIWMSVYRVRAAGTIAPERKP